LGETVYLREIEKGCGKLVKIEIAAIANVKDPVKGRIGKKKFFVIRSTELPPLPMPPFQGEGARCDTLCLPAERSRGTVGSPHSSRQ
jgi:hypothetical protein